MGQKSRGGKCLGQQRVSIADPDEGTQLLGAQSFLPDRQQPLLPLFFLFRKDILIFMLNLTLFNMSPVFQKHGSKDQVGQTRPAGTRFACGPLVYRLQTHFSIALWTCRIWLLALAASEMFRCLGLEGSSGGRCW